METGKVSKEFVRLVKRESALRKSLDSWSVVLFGFSTAAIFTTLAALIAYRIFPTQKFGVKFTAIVAGVWLLAEIVAIIGYAHARSKHLRAAEDLDVVCKSTCVSEPQD